MIKNFFLISAVLFLCSCNQGSEKHENEAEEIKPVESENSFQVFLDKFHTKSLPIEIRGCQISADELAELNAKNDQPFITDNSFAFRQIPTNGDYKAVIILGIADCYIPILKTFTNSGKLIDEKPIAIGYCGAGPCFQCTETMIIKEDFSLYTADTMKIAECDSNYNPIQGTESIEIIYKEGRLTKTGEIKLSEEIKKEITNQVEKNETIIQIENPIDSIESIYVKYINQEESTDSKQNKELMKNSIKSIGRLNESSEFEILINVWMYYDPTDFPSRSLVFNKLSQQPAQSLIAIEERIKNKFSWESEDVAPLSELGYLKEQLKELEK